jgi:hypothetical protein
MHKLTSSRITMTKTKTVRAFVWNVEHEAYRRLWPGVTPLPDITMRKRHDQIADVIRSFCKDKNYIAILTEVSGDQLKLIESCSPQRKPHVVAKLEFPNRPSEHPEAPLKNPYEHIVILADPSMEVTEDPEVKIWPWPGNEKGFVKVELDSELVVYAFHASWVDEQRRQELEYIIDDMANEWHHRNGVESFVLAGDFNKNMEDVEVEINQLIKINKYPFACKRQATLFDTRPCSKAERDHRLDGFFVFGKASVCCEALVPGTSELSDHLPVTAVIEYPEYDASSWLESVKNPVPGVQPTVATPASVTSLMIQPGIAYPPRDDNPGIIEWCATK